MNLEEAIAILNQCLNLEQLATTWRSMAGECSRRFDKNDADQLIRVKNDLKRKLAAIGPSDPDRRCDTLLEAYPDVGSRNNKVHWPALCTMSGWRDKLAELEECFMQAYDGDADCYSEFQVLRKHWQAGIKAISADKERKSDE